MAKPNPHKRKLKFADFSELTVEINQLLEQGYISHGNWNLSQILGHLNDWMRFPMDGYPVPPLPIRIIMWVMSKTVAPGMKRKILTNGFSDGVPTAPNTIPQPDAMTDQAAAQQFQETINRFQSFTGDLYASPLFGPMDKEMAITVNLLHAEHHLGFLEPKGRPQ